MGVEILCWQRAFMFYMVTDFHANQRGLQFNVFVTVWSRLQEQYIDKNTECGNNSKQMFLQRQSSAP